MSFDDVVAQANIVATVSQQAFNWIIAHGPKIVLIIVGAWLAHKFIHRILMNLIRRIIVPSRFPSKEAEKKTEDTIIGVFHSVVVVLIWLVALMMILSDVGVDIAPLIAGAGVIGLAFGFGAQYLIRDIISGLFIILEGQYRVGDVVCLDSTCGKVEDVNLRVTILRDVDGVVHHVPNGSIGIASNKAKTFSRVRVEIGVAYDADIDTVEEIVNRVGKELAKEAEWKEHITEAPTFNRITEFADSSVNIRILGETKPGKQVGVEGELRKRIKKAFDEAGIEIPFPQMVVHKPQE